MSEIFGDFLQDYPYLWVFIIILSISVAPVLTPPTWMVVASAFALSDNSLNPYLLAAMSAIAATAGRVILLKYSSIGRRKLGEKRKASLQRLEKFLNKKRYGYFIGTLIFALTPLPSNMLFISYGLINARSLGIIAGFWSGRFVVYLTMIYVSNFVFTPLVNIFGDNVVAVITADIAGIIMTLTILMVDWEKVIVERRLAVIKPKLK